MNEMCFKVSRVVPFLQNTQHFSRYIELSRWKLDPITHDIDHEETIHTNKMIKPGVKLRMLGRAGESKPGKASSNGVTSCN
jgi:hypothetical protein